MRGDGGWIGGLLAGVMLLAAPALAQPAAPSADRSYEVHFEARLVPTERVAKARIRLGKGASAVRWIQLRIDPDRHQAFEADGTLETGDGVVRWRPPKEGGSLRYTFLVDQLRSSKTYDARCADNWALLRADDLFPPAKVRSVKGATSRSTLRLRAPNGWSIATPYRSLRDGRFEIIDGERRFDRPLGWMLAGRLGIVRERIAGSRIAIAGPVGQGVRRQDMLAFLRWTLPALRDALGPLPPRVLVVSAGDPMWRGGLSGPNSVYLHANRPLIGPDGTSPLLHELVHMQMRARAGKGGDWIVEGLAEYYSLEVLRRSRSISRRRYERSHERLADKGRSAVRLSVETADSVVTARAVGLMRELARRIEAATDGEADLDDVVAALVRSGEPVTHVAFRAAVVEVAGRDLLPAIAGR